MLLLLQNTGDQSAGWLHQQLSMRGLKPIVVTVDEILTPKHFTLELVDGQYTSSIELQNGRQIDSRAVRAIINRVNVLPSLFNATFRKEDADYVYQEWQAILLSWLHAMRGTILFNPPAPTGLAGEQFNTQEWMLMAARAGLPTLAYEQSHDQGEHWHRPSTPAATVTLISFEGKAFNDLRSAIIPEEIKRAATSLQQLSGLPLIGVQLFTDKRHWYFAGATANPSLQQGGAALAEAITRRVKCHAAPALPAEASM